MRNISDFDEYIDFFMEFELYELALNTLQLKYKPD
jgi:hypothetical protein